MGLKNWKGSQLERAVKAVTERNMRKAVLTLEGKAKRTATDMKVVDTGRYRASITSSVSDGFNTSGKAVTSSDTVGNVDGTRTIVRGVVGTNVEYAKEIEFGTSRMGARPVLRNAFESSKKRIAKIFGGKTNIKF